jgi:hypothetical protein
VVSVPLKNTGYCLRSQQEVFISLIQRVYSRRNFFTITEIISLHDISLFVNFSGETGGSMWIETDFIKVIYKRFIFK